MPVDLKQIEAELANHSHSGRSDFEFTKFDRLQIAYGSKYQPTTKKIKLFSWPPTGGQLAKKLRMHFKLGQSGKNSCICPKSIDAEASCPVCDLIESVTQSGDELQRKAIVNFVSRERFWMLCLDLTEMAATNNTVCKVYVWNAPPTVYTQIATHMQTSYGDFTALPQSYILQLLSHSEGGNRAGITNASGLPEQVNISYDSIKHLFPDLEAIVKPPPAAIIEAMLYKSPNVPTNPNRRTSGNVVTQPVNLTLIGATPTPVNVVTQPVMQPVMPSGLQPVLNPVVAPIALPVPATPAISVIQPTSFPAPVAVQPVMPQPAVTLVQPPMSVTPVVTGGVDPLTNPVNIAPAPVRRSVSDILASKGK